MRHCPNCGEPIDDGIDVCRNCGTARDGNIADNARAQPPDPEGSDAAQREDPEDASQGAAMPDDRNGGRIVELYSAANVFEALALHNELEQAGIRSRLAGELLENAPGALPLGQITAPRLWVWDEDLPRAREIGNAWIRRADQGGRISDEEDESTEVDEEPDEGTAAPASDRRSTGPDCVWTVAGLACIAIGIFWAGHRWAALRTYSAATEGVLTRYKLRHSTHVPPPPEIPRSHERATIHFWYEAFYAFNVGPWTYYAVTESGIPPARRAMIHYDPSDPNNNFVGPLPSPWDAPAWAMGIGASLLFASCRRRWRRQAARV